MTSEELENTVRYLWSVFLSVVCGVACFVAVAGALRFAGMLFGV